MYKKIIIALLLNFSISFTMATKLNDITIIVPSCDKYSSLWTPCFDLLFKHWPSLKDGENANVPILLISNEKAYDNPRIQVINIKNERTWSTNVKEALKHVKTTYVMIFLEDYIVNKRVDEEKFVQQFEFLKQQDGAFLQVSAVDHNAQSFMKDDQNLPVRQFTKHSKYRTSLQAGIWRADALEWLIKDDENPWKFEIDSSTRSEGMMRPFYAVKENLINYLNASNNSTLQVKVLKYIKDQGIEIEPTLPTSDPFSSKLRHYKFRVKSFLYWEIYLPVKNFAKSIL